MENVRGQGGEWKMGLGHCTQLTNGCTAPLTAGASRMGCYMEKNGFQEPISTVMRKVPGRKETAAKHVAFEL